MTRRGIRSYMIAFAAIWLIAMTAGCASGTDSGKGAAPSTVGGENAAGNQLEKIRYAPLSGASGLAVSFGAEKGFFEEEGLDVEFITTKDPIAGLTSKDIDVVDVATTT
ncbi:ABC transporter substrate-binding protein, partial [Clostridium perfringens]